MAAVTDDIYSKVLEYLQRNEILKFISGLNKNIKQLHVPEILRKKEVF